MSTNRVVYVVTSEGRDFYTAMTRISICSLRLANPEIEVVLACDALTIQKLEDQKDSILQEVDECLNIETPEGPSVFRNRFVKTRLRNELSGPYLHLDSDTLVRGDISPIFMHDEDLAAARNHNREGFEGQTWTEDRDVLKTLDWSVGETYFNGGVVFWNDTPKAYSVAEQWHDRWLTCSQKLGSYRDQPAFNSSLDEIQPRLHVIDDKFNSQLAIEPRVAPDAIIWHYYFSKTQTAETGFGHYVREVTKSNQISDSRVDLIAKRPHPWGKGSWIDSRIASRLIEGGKLSRADRLWLQGQRLESIRLRLISMGGKVRSKLIR